MEIQKKYYKIEEVAQTINQPASTIRFWEISMRWLTPKVRNRSNHRKYTVDEIRLIKQVGDLTNWGMGLRGINEAYKKGYFQPLYESLLTLHKKYDDTTGIKN